jgi:hypothetical protein
MMNSRAALLNELGYRSLRIQNLKEFKMSARRIRLERKEMSLYALLGDRLSVVHFKTQEAKQLLQAWEVSNGDSNVIESDHIRELRMNLWAQTTLKSV